MTELTEKDLAWRRGVESGVFYIFGHIDSKKFTDQELLQFASFIELKRPWKTTSEWYELIKKAQGRGETNG